MDSKCNNNIRVCIDSKQLNESLIQNHYQPPTLEDSLPELH